MVEEVAEPRRAATPTHPVPEDNSVGRLLTLSDGVFAIAMTLLALDLKVPALGSDPRESVLRHALAHQSSLYYSFLASFYIIGSYWMRHRRIMRSLIRVDGTLVRDTMALLVLVAVMPFPASLLGEYGGEPVALAVYGAVSAAASAVLMRLSYDVTHFGLGDPADSGAGEFHRSWHGWFNLAVFLLCIPAGFVLGGKGPFVLLLLLVPARVGLVRRGVNYLRRRRVSGRRETPT